MSLSLPALLYFINIFSSLKSLVSILFLPENFSSPYFGILLKVKRSLNIICYYFHHCLSLLLLGSWKLYCLSHKSVFDSFTIIDNYVKKSQNFINLNNLEDSVSIDLLNWSNLCTSNIPLTRRECWSFIGYERK